MPRACLASTIGLGTAIACLAVLAVSTSACACCSSPGQRHVETQRIDAHAAGVLAEIRFAARAHLFTGEADVEMLKGITARSRDFTLTVRKSPTVWVLAFAEPGGGGTLTFTLPASITKFEVDPREPRSGRPPDATDDPALYKEWRLTAKAVGTGMLRPSSGGKAQATLILHGRGNACTDASHFNAWSLVLHGGTSTNTLYGDLLR